MATNHPMPKHHKFRDLAGQVFGRLTVKSYAGRNSHHNSLWLCRCECGETKVVQSPLLLDGRTQSCGCLRRAVYSSMSVLWNMSHIVGRRNSSQPSLSLTHPVASASATARVIP